MTFIKNIYICQDNSDLTQNEEKMKAKLFLMLVMTATMFFTNDLMAQEEENEKESKFTPGADFYSNFIWRGSKLGTGPSFQPYLEFASGGLTLGAWGSFDALGYAETDLYVSYDFPFGLSLGVTDYYMSNLDISDFSDSTGSHAFELTAGFEINGLSLSANYIPNEAGGVGSVGDDLYFEAGYAFEYFNIFLGAGNGWYTSDGEFNICNVGIGAEKEIKVTDSFSVRVKGQVVFNPEKKNLFIVIGFSL
jgi:hypothetical protein